MNPEIPVPAQQPPPIESRTADAPRIVGYCRACGKSLDESEARTSHGTIYCQDHVPQEPPPIQATPPPISSSPYTAPYAAPIASSPYTAPQIVNPSVSPTAAFALGVIPGVG